ncbi:hypothetical protein E3N88_17273 [Mikania micrantha]|uniref:Uncharacterized protein n=1 Tax=Mikania micrantha TaxID=192012 RepID=A0A5N6NUE0_9ASTR|nr:hypothetical protein E3N88_17273 [Mikania micrantha]
MVSIKKSASEFSSNAQKIWNAITENKDLNLSVSKGVKQKRQPIKSMVNLKKIADRNLKTKVNLMKDSIFYSLSSVTKGRESSGTLVLALCKYYDYNKRGFQLNKETFFGFCTKEIAKIIGMEDKGSIYQENLDANENLEPSYVNDLRTEFSSSVGAFTVKQMKEILKNMTVNDAESKQRFRTLLTFYLIEQVLLCHRNCRVSTSLWSSVVDLDACERVNWAKATEDQLHKSMKEAQAWVEKNDSNQHIFTGATPAILYERIPSMRPNKLTDEEPPIQKWKPLRRDEKWMASALSKLTPSDILTCKHCSDSSENEHCSEILYPYCDAPNPVQIVYDDIDCLAIGKWLNDSIMNFYLRSHWSLIRICMPGKEANTGPVILHLDSLQSHDTSKIVENIARKNWSFFSLDSTAVEKVHFDEQWFEPKEAHAMRTRLKSLLIDLFQHAREDRNDVAASAPPAISEDNASIIHELGHLSLTSTGNLDYEMHQTEVENEAPVLVVDANRRSRAGRVLKSTVLYKS